MFQVSALFAKGEDVLIFGETKTFNGLEVNGVPAANGDDVTYHFCPTCGSTVFWRFKAWAVDAIAVGSFADSDFPPPTVELHTPYRHRWPLPVEGAAQFEAFQPK